MPGSADGLPGYARGHAVPGDADFVPGPGDAVPGDGDADDVPDLGDDVSGAGGRHDVHFAADGDQQRYCGDGQHDGDQAGDFRHATPTADVGIPIVVSLITRSIAGNCSERRFCSTAFLFDDSF